MWSATSPAPSLMACCWRSLTSTSRGAVPFFLASRKRPTAVASRPRMAVFLSASCCSRSCVRALKMASEASLVALMACCWRSLTSTSRGAVPFFLDAKKNGTAPRDVDVSDLQQQAIRLGAGDVADHIGTVKDAYQHNEYKNDPNLLAGFLNKLHQGPYVLTKGELRTALKDKNLSLETYNSLNNALETAQREAEDRRRAGRPFLADDPDRNAGIAAIDRIDRKR